VCFQRFRKIGNLEVEMKTMIGPRLKDLASLIIIKV
jgi:hypothetical protein